MPRMSLRQLLAKTGGRFLVPTFQRRYVWGQARPGENDSAQHLTECLARACDHGLPYFLQGITLAKTPGGWMLVDGQQRLTYLYLLCVGAKAVSREEFAIAYACRPQAQAWLELPEWPTQPAESDTKDIHFFKHTLRAIGENAERLAAYALDNVHFLIITIDDEADAIPAFKMMNGTKMPMLPADIIKADILRMASDGAQPNAQGWELDALRLRYATEWEGWMQWWHTPAVAQYYAGMNDRQIDLLLKLCLRDKGDDASAPLTYAEFRQAIERSGSEPYHAAKHFYHQLRHVQKRIEEAFADPEAYNRIRAVMLLQAPQARFDFLHALFVDEQIDREDLVRYYRLSFLGMSIDDIAQGHSPEAKFDELLAILSMADVYHNEAKREVFNLLLRLNIDEDIKLGRKFDFSVWNNRSLEHIYSKSKVWHVGADGKCYDGNDNLLPMSKSQLRADRSYICRTDIVNLDGAHLSEHCIGNLVLLYGENNSAFGNAGFGEKKLMFLTPGAMGVFQSRNLLHSVCVFAGNNWSARSIVDNYNLTLKNLKLYYGYK